MKNGNNFIYDSYFAKMPALRHLSQRVILSGVRLSVRKWQKIPGCEFLCNCTPCNCIKTRMFSAHSNLFLCSICMNKEKVEYIEPTHYLLWHFQWDKDGFFFCNMRYPNGTVSYDILSLFHTGTHNIRLTKQYSLR